MLDLSVIIPVYNAEALIERCLKSVVEQTTQYTFEIICVDDGSTDRSCRIIEGIRTEATCRVNLMHQENAGPAAARNKGIGEAQGRYITFIDSDDYWEDGYVEQTVSYLDDNPTCVAVSVGCKNVNQLNGNVVYTPYWLQEGKKVEPFVVKDFFRLWGETCFVGTCSTTLKTDVVKMCGGMRTDLKFTEDFEFWNYVSTFGEWGIVPKVLYVSDGGKIIQNSGWLDKMKKRWASTVTTDVWEKRIIQRINADAFESYEWARGRVARDLAYSLILDGRFWLGRTETLKYGKYFNKDKIAMLLNAMKHTYLLWWIMCKLLVYREYHRKV